MKTVTVGQLRQNPTGPLEDVEAGETYRVTRHAHEVAQLVPPTRQFEMLPRKRSSGSRLARLPRHELRTATTIDQLLADERDL